MDCKCFLSKLIPEQNLTYFLSLSMGLRSNQSAESRIGPSQCTGVCVLM